MGDNLHDDRLGHQGVQVDGLLRGHEDQNGSARQQAHQKLIELHLWALRRHAQEERQCRQAPSDCRHEQEGGQEDT